ncbi:hypothetical protein D186_23726, partial [Citrobacter freundii ATCC 8090 = MTCC 1658 = NBRC 12681]
MIPFQRSICFKGLILREAILLVTKPTAQKAFGIGLRLSRQRTPSRLKRIIKILGKWIGTAIKNGTWWSASS